MKYIKKISLKKALCLIIIFSIFFTCFLFANYRSALSGKGTGSVATVALSIGNETSLNLPISPLSASGNQYFNFEILNRKNEMKNDVTMKYYIEIISDYDNLPLNVFLYRQNKNNQYELLNLDSNKTEDFILGFSEDISDRYKLVVNWNQDAENYNDYRFSKTIDFIKLNVVSEQVD